MQTVDERTLIEVSIPFIAGQWSLRHGPRAGPAARKVSIPFIAGQWSLRGGGARKGGSPLASQSPSLRGSGRFAPRVPRGGSELSGSQSPSLRGSGRFARARRAQERAKAGLNPLHCGAVVASKKAYGAEYEGVLKSQSPSLRGSGRFLETERAKRLENHMSQSPSLRGSGRFRKAHALRRCTTTGLNPLHCGAVVASMRSPPAAWRRGESQSPSLRGSGRFDHQIGG